MKCTKSRTIPSLAVISALLAAGCAGNHVLTPRVSSPPVPSTTTTTVPPHQSDVATATVPDVPVFTSPAASTPFTHLANPRPLGGPLVLLVTARRPGWIQALLPIRPNESTGWVRLSDVSLSTHDYWIVIGLSAHVITVYRDDTVVDQEPIGVGRGATPTPGGVFYTEDFVKLTDPGGPYGPYAYGLSGFSDVLLSFGGGPGQLALHGTNDPSGLGHDVSHGCIRMSNAGITKLAGFISRGVPVFVKA